MVNVDLRLTDLISLSERITILTWFVISKFHPNTLDEEILTAKIVPLFVDAQMIIIHYNQ